MRVGTFYDFRNPAAAQRSTPTLYAQTLDNIVHAESLGFDDIWVAEHHFVDDGYMPSPLIACSAIGARTSRVQIGQHVLLTPFYHPIRLAEDSVVLDNLTDGRFFLGCAIGYRVEEFETYRVDRRHRGEITQEAIEIIRRCWTEEKFSYHGKYFQFDDVRVTPRPSRESGIPLWIGGFSGPAVRRAAQLGDGWMASAAALGDYELYRRTLRECGKDSGPLNIAAAGALWVHTTEDPERDWDIIKPWALQQAQSYMEWLERGGVSAFPIPRDYEELAAMNLIVVDTPENVLRNIQEAYERIPFSRYVFGPIIAGMPVEMANESMALFADKVLPSLRTLDGE